MTRVEVDAKMILTFNKDKLTKEQQAERVLAVERFLNDVGSVSPDGERIAMRVHFGEFK